MADFDSVRDSINASIKQNGTGAITGPVLNGVLNEMVDAADDQVSQLSLEVIGSISENYNAVAGAETATYDFPVAIQSGETVTLIAKTDGAVVNTFRVYANQIGTAIMENANSTVQFTAQEDITKFVIYIRNVATSGVVTFMVDFGEELSLQSLDNKISEISEDISEEISTEISKAIGVSKAETDVSVNPDTIYVTMPIPTINAGKSVRLIFKSDAVIGLFRVYGNAVGQEQVRVESANDEAFYRPSVDVNSLVLLIRNCTVAGTIKLEIVENNGIAEDVSYANNRLDSMPNCYGRAIKLDFESGYWRYSDGAFSASQTYKVSSAMLPVNEGDTFVFLTDAGESVAVVAAYGKYNLYQKEKSLAGMGTYMAVKYVVPAGIRKLRFTLSSSDNYTPFVTQVYKAQVGQADSIDTGIYQKENIVLTSGVPVKLDGTNCHKTNWVIEANFRGITGFSNILVGKGVDQNMAHGGMWLNITPYAVVPTYSTGAYQGVDHGLTITDYLDVRIESFVDKTDESESYTGAGDATYIRYTLFDGTKQFTLDKVFFLGSEQPFIQVNGTSSAKANLYYWCTDLKSGLWCYGDSYFSIAQTRWPYWILTRGYNALFNGMPGANSEYMWKRFCYDLMCGNPRKVFWCLGMNDKDASSAANSSWASHLTKVEDICRLRGIELVLCTIPEVPSTEASNVYKNEVVRTSGYPYVDFAAAVMKADGTGWFDGMMEDAIHPSKTGARCLANAAMKLFVSYKANNEV